jgi:hypothetical protein
LAASVPEHGLHDEGRAKHTFVPGHVLTARQLLSLCPVMSHKCRNVAALLPRWRLGHTVELTTH